MKNVLSALLLIFLAISCQTPQTSHKVSKHTFEKTSFEVDKKLDEISGLQIDKDYFYGFNDSGGEPELYKIDKQGKIAQTIVLENAKNKDWESLAMNDSLIFISDAGNNFGNRKNLCIYYIKRTDILANKAVQKVKAQKISFYYLEQTNFSKTQLHKHDFDCEAICWYNGKLHLFTKEWKSKQTHHYTLNLSTEKQAAKLVGSFDTKFLVTGADILQTSENSATLALIGYNKLGSVHLICSTIPNGNDNLLAFPKTHTNLGNTLNLGQVEGIAIASPTIFYYSAEDFKKIPQHITKLQLKK